MKWLLLFFTVLYNVTASADVTLAIGAGKNVFAAPGTPFERVAALGYQMPFGDFYVRPEVIYFEDLAGGGQRSSAIITSKLGVRAMPADGIELHIAFGPSYLENPDTILGGHFQFSLEGGPCINDGKNALCVAWYHTSSAGIEMPNNGRDFVMIQWRILTLWD